MVEIDIIIRHRRGEDFPMIGWYYEPDDRDCSFITHSQDSQWTVEDNIECMKRKAVQVLSRINEKELREPWTIQPLGEIKFNIIESFA